jgi:hypothetical protein
MEMFFATSVITGGVSSFCLVGCDFDPFLSGSRTDEIRKLLEVPMNDI